MPIGPQLLSPRTVRDVAYVPPEHTYRLAAHGVPHTAHVFAHGPHSLGLARGSGDAAAWTTLAAAWIAEQSQTRGDRQDAVRPAGQPRATSGDAR